MQAASSSASFKKHKHLPHELIWIQPRYFSTEPQMNLCFLLPCLSREESMTPKSVNADVLILWKWKSAVACWALQFFRMVATESKPQNKPTQTRHRCTTRDKLPMTKVMEKLDPHHHQKAGRTEVVAINQISGIIPFSMRIFTRSLIFPRWPPLLTPSQTKFTSLCRLLLGPEKLRSSINNLLPDWVYHCLPWPLENTDFPYTATINLSPKINKSRSANSLFY